MRSFLQLLAQAPDFGRKLLIQFFRVQFFCLVEVRRWRTLSMTMTARSSLTVDVGKLAISACRLEFRLRIERW